MRADKSNHVDVDPPLRGIKVLDFTTLLPGPLATLMLAEAGAEVIRIERPGSDDTYLSRPSLPTPQSALAALLNRGKRCITLDLRTEAGQQEALRWVSQADILVEQNRPGVMDRFGLGYAQLAASHPRLVYCSITGYGQTGPHANLAGHDLNYLADAGLLAAVSSPRQAPVLPAAPIADIGGGSLPAVVNILLALWRRERSNVGCHLDVAMTRNVMTFQAVQYAQRLASTGHARAPVGLLTGGSPRYQLYQTADRRWLALGALEQKFWDEFCDAIGLQSPLRDDSIDPSSTMRAVAEVLRQKSAADWLRLMAGRDTCVSLVRTFDEAVGERQDIPLPLDPVLSCPAQ